MNKTVSAIYINSKHKSWMIHILYALYAFLGAYGAVMSFVSCFDFGKDNLFYLVPVAITILVCMLFLADKLYKKVLPAILLGIGAFAYICLDKITGSFITVANIVIDGINESYQMGLSRLFYPGNTALYRERELFLLLAAVLISVMIGFFVMGYASALGCILVSLPFTVFGIFFDLFPALKYLIMSVVFWIIAVTLGASGRKGRRRSDAAVCNALLLAVMVFIIFGISQKVMPGDNYNKSEKLNEVRSFLEQHASQIVAEVSGMEGTKEESGGMGHGEFGDRDKIYFSGHTMLEAKIPLLNQNIYLRSVEYNEYTGNAWASNSLWFETYFGDFFEDKGKENRPQNFTGSLLKQTSGELAFYDISEEEYAGMVKEYEITIENIGEGGYIFAPYGAVMEANNLHHDVVPTTGEKKCTYNVYMADAGTFVKKADVNQFITYWDMVWTQDRTDILGIKDAEFYVLADAQKDYAAFVRKAYTQIPEELAGVLRKYAPYTVEYEYDAAMEFVREIQRMFLNDYTYTLEPGKVPDGRDGVEYFLEENKKGYCVYFASAATLIFRMAGIPARYVEGYVITPDMAKINRRETVSITRKIGDEAFEEEVDYVTVTVPDNKAHAWVEIYIAGYGWIPVEVTPGYYTAGELEMTEERPTEEETTTMEKETETEKETTKPEEQNKQEPDRKINWKEFGKVLLALILLTAFLTAAAWMAVKWYQGGRKKILAIMEGSSDIDTKRRACLAWWYIEEVLRFIGKAVPDNISCEEQKRFLKENTEFFSKGDFDDKIDNIIRAYFGNENLTDDEITKIGEMIREFRTETYESLSGLQKFCFRYLKRF